MKIGRRRYRYGSTPLDALAGKRRENASNVVDILPRRASIVDARCAGRGARLVHISAPFAR